MRAPATRHRSRTRNARPWPTGSSRTRGTSTICARRPTGSGTNCGPGPADGPDRTDGGRYPRPMTYRAVFFDAGETLVHPHPTFAELFALVLHREGYDVDPAVVADSTHVISQRFEEAVSDMWTTSPERSRAFWHSVYERLLEHVGVPNPNGLADD